MWKPRVNLLAPALCLAVLGAVYVERGRRLTPADVEPYHARAKRVVNEVRYTIGLWTGVDVPVPTAAQQLLRPNVLLSRAYLDNTPVRLGTVRAAAPARLSLLIVQCRDPRDMSGHYPPNCYPAHGALPAGSRPITVTLPASADGRPPLTLHCTEYRFTSDLAGHRVTTVVLNTLVVPGVGTTPDMSGVRTAAGDYQRRMFGAAQIQIVLGDAFSDEQRREIYGQFLTACAGAVRELLDVDVHGGPASGSSASPGVAARPIDPPTATSTTP